MRLFVRALLFFTLLLQTNASFIIFPTKEWALKEEFDKVMDVVKTHCRPDQYYHPDSISLEFSKLKEEIAYCQIRINGFKIVFDKHYWNEYTLPIDRTQLMMHEVSHCIFRQEHIEDTRHFMAPFFVPILEPELTRQFHDYLKAKCGN